MNVGSANSSNNINTRAITRKEASEYSKKAKEISKIPNLVERNIEASKLLDEISKRQSSFLAKQLTFTPASAFLVATFAFGTVKTFVKNHSVGIDKAFKKCGIATIATLLAGFIASSFIKEMDDKQKDASRAKIQAHIDKYNKENNANVTFEIRKSTLNDNVAASFSSAAGKLLINPDYAYDPLYSKTHLGYFVEHELAHAKQFAQISLLDNGIEKLNYIFIKSEAQRIQKNTKTRENFDKTLQEIKQNPQKYKDLVFAASGNTYNMVDYFTTVNKFFENPNISENDLPILINKQYYEDIRSKHPKLTSEEEKQARQYLEAAQNYPQVTTFEIINPFSNYHQNPLEKEASKNRPWYTYLF